MFKSSSATKRNTHAVHKVDKNRKAHSVEPAWQPPPRENASNKHFFLFLLIAGVFAGYYLILVAQKSPIVIDENGNATLAPHRQKKRAKELEEIDNTV